MPVLIGIALKSLLIAGLTLGLLQLMRNRSAAERSWVAHVGLLALVIVAFAPLVLPSWTVRAPSILDRAHLAATVSQPAASAVSAKAVVGTSATPMSVAAAPTASVHRASADPVLDPIAASTALYAIPAAILLLLTFLALARLVALRARAEVLVDAHWLSALARAQRRMGFKHGTALLTSNELASPISWGVMRPVILLNSRAVEATAEAEAIIAHELAHVARMDWIKLLLARITTALFWFNPLVWALAREAHQLREETADDTVLAADISDTDYAQLLVGVARHECPGLLLGAHGVAPSKSSLARRVARVLDGKSVRGPAARGFAAGVFAGAVLVAAPLAALTFTPAAPKTLPTGFLGLAAASSPAASYPEGSGQAADLPHIIARGVSASVTTAVAAATAVTPDIVNQQQRNFRVESPNGATVEEVNGKLVSTGPNGATVTIYPPDANGRKKIVARAANGATSVTYANADDWADRHHNKAIDRAIEMKAVGVTPEYVGAMRAAVPRLGAVEFEDFAQFKAVGVTPEFARDLVSAGFPSITADQLTEARAVGVTGAYVRAMRATGLQGNIDDFIELRAVGVDPGFAARVKASGLKVRSAEDLVELRAIGVTRPPVPPIPPVPPRAWNPDPNPDG
ncbi:M56 family metallopeptidase [Sphingomonas sp.]|uniref:M56 family metallopeptidase n=1 Tax=Sphingomonas sp. TaxID=28214 RepID=UPI0038AA5291